jgi:thiopurine S-methyltransferase
MKELDTLYWQKRWQENNIAFHEGAENELLTHHLGKLELIKGSRIFIPLCGKTRDIAWLLSKGYSVAGIELSEIAVQAVFFELGITANVKTITTTNKQQATSTLNTI